jgi:hypothetical protein
LLSLFALVGVFWTTKSAHLGFVHGERYSLQIALCRKTLVSSAASVGPDYVASVKHREPGELHLTRAFGATFDMFIKHGHWLAFVEHSSFTLE